MARLVKGPMWPMVLGPVVMPNLDKIKDPAELQEVARVFARIASISYAMGSILEARKAGDEDIATAMELSVRDEIDRLPEWARW